MTISEEVLELVSEAAAEPVSLDSEFDSLGLDSLDVTNLILLIDNKFGTKLDFEAFMSLRTVGDLVNILPGEIQ